MILRNLSLLCHQEAEKVCKRPGIVSVDINRISWLALWSWSLPSSSSLGKDWCSIRCGWPRRMLLLLLLLWLPFALIKKEDRPTKLMLLLFWSALDVVVGVARAMVDKLTTVTVRTPMEKSKNKTKTSKFLLFGGEGRWEGRRSGAVGFLDPNWNSPGIFLVPPAWWWRWMFLVVAMTIIKKGKWDPPEIRIRTSHALIKDSLKE